MAKSKDSGVEWILVIIVGLFVLYIIGRQFGWW